MVQGENMNLLKQVIIGALLIMSIVFIWWLLEAMPTVAEIQKGKELRIDQKIKDCRAQFGDVEKCDGTGGARMGL